MDYQIKVIELVTENLGTFTFTNHFNAPTVSAYDAMVSFESNNWEKLGETKYVVTLLWEDDTNTTQTYEGINASCHLSELIEE